MTLGVSSNTAFRLPESNRRFAHLTRRWNDEHSLTAVRLRPGEYYVTASKELITTFLGSCIAACVRDRRSGAGGMNHFMLPEPLYPGGPEWGVASRPTRYGSAAMEQLINDVLANGGRKRDLEVKLFGGGRVLERMTDIGRRNIDFALRYLELEKLAVAARDLGGAEPRELHYFPHTGVARVRRLARRDEALIAARERAYERDLAEASVGGELELFRGVHGD